MKPPSTAKPPAHLRAEGRRLWAQLRAGHEIDDPAGLTLLQTACEAADRCAQARELIDQQGPVVKDRFGQPKAHPACGIERDAHTQLLAALRALRLEPEP